MHLRTMHSTYPARKAKARKLRFLERLEDRRLMAGDAITGLGAAGDSLTDEYSETSFLETYQYARSWMQLVGETGVFTGEPGPFAEPRRSGNAFNWARWGATSGQLLSAGQHTNLAQQADVSRVSHAVLAVGQNDFNPYIGSQYSDIYNGRWTTSRINSYVNQVVGNITTALSTLANSNAYVVVSNILDPGAAPKVRSAYPTASKRDRVTAVIDTVNARLLEVADQHNVPLADLNGVAKFFFGTNRVPIASRQIGGVTVTNTAGSGTTNAFVHDGLHPHTMVQAQLANLFLETFHEVYDTPVDTFTEAETVALVGRTYGGQNTLNLNFANYVRRFANDAPIVSGLTDSTYVENGPAVLISPDAVVADADGLNFSHGKLTLALGDGAAAADRLEILSAGTGPGEIGLSQARVTYGGVAIGTYSGGVSGTPLEIEFNAQARAAEVQAVLRNIIFRTTGENPSTTPRTIEVTLSDGDGATSAVMTCLAHVEAVNDAPGLALSGELSYTENAVPLVLAPTPTLFDFDSPVFEGGHLQAVLAGGDAADVLAIRHQGFGAGQIGISGDSVSFSGVEVGTFSGGSWDEALLVSLNENATIAATRAILRNVTFRTVTDDPSTTQRSVSFRVADGDGGESEVQSVTVDVVAVNDRPNLVGNVEGTISYTAEAAAVTLLPSATVSDPDSDDFDLGRLIVAVTAGDDAANRLEIGGPFVVIGNEVQLDGTTIGTLNNNAGVGLANLVVNFNANMTSSIAEQLARAITFRTSGTTAPGTRTIGVSLQDGDGGSSTLSLTVEVAS